MSSTLGNETSSPDLREDNDAVENDGISTASPEGSASSKNEENEDEVETKDDDHDKEDQQKAAKGSRSRLSWRRSKASLFDYVVKGADDDDGEEELRDSELGDHYAAKYDLTEFRADAMKLADRQEMIAALRELRSESKVLTVKNKFLHKQYTAAIRNSPSYANALDKFDEAVVFQDDRYYATLEKYEQTRDDVDERRATLRTALEELEESFAYAESNFQELFENLMGRELAIARKIKPRKTAKEVWLEEVDRLLANQRNRLSDVAKIRLVYVRLYYQLEKLQASLQEFDNLGPGYSMMDYEYLLKKKEVYSEKSDDQRENIKRIEEKNFSCAAIIKHIDEESDLYNQKIKEESDGLNEITAENKIEHSKAVQLMKERALTFKNIMKLREEIGLLDNPYLIRKMEFSLEEIAGLKKRIEALKSKILTDKKKATALLLQKSKNNKV